MRYIICFKSELWSCGGGIIKEVNTKKPCVSLSLLAPWQKHWGPWISLFFSPSYLDSRSFLQTFWTKLSVLSVAQPFQDFNFISQWRLLTLNDFPKMVCFLHINNLCLCYKFTCDFLMCVFVPDFVLNRVYTRQRKSLTNWRSLSAVLCSSSLNKGWFSSQKRRQRAAYSRW